MLSNNLKNLNNLNNLNNVNNIKLKNEYMEAINYYPNLLQSRNIIKKDVKIYDGKQLKFEDIKKNPNILLDPFVVKDPTILGMKVPPSNFKARDILKNIGLNKRMTIIDVEKQQEMKEQITLRKWLKYYENPNEREKVLNSISLEFTNTKLTKYVQSPEFVKEFGWLESMWPDDLKDEAPKIQLYCLMSSRGSYTDFHVDFGGSSVWYHIQEGTKIFYCIPPSKQNLEIYENWSKKHLKAGEDDWIFLPELTNECFSVTLNTGDTFVIPSGWIHAVLTPTDAIAFGGNFIHGLSIPMQLECQKIDNRINIDKKFHFPKFSSVHWNATVYYLQCLDGKLGNSAVLNNSKYKHRDLLQQELDGIPLLIRTLKKWIEITDNAILKEELKNDTFIKPNKKRKFHQLENDGMENTCLEHIDLENPYLLYATDYSEAFLRGFISPQALLDNLLKYVNYIKEFEKTNASEVKRKECIYDNNNKETIFYLHKDERLIEITNNKNETERKRKGKRKRKTNKEDEDQHAKKKSMIIINNNIDQRTSYEPVKIFNSIKIIQSLARYMLNEKTEFTLPNKIFNLNGSSPRKKTKTTD